VVDGDEIAKTLFCFRKYSGPMIHLLNKTGLPWMSVSVDSRYTPLMARDLFNQPRFSISQVNKRDRKRKIIRSYEDQSYVMVSNEHVYSGIETLFLTMKKKPDPDSYCQKKNTMMTVILNEGGNGAWKRGPILAEYVLNNPSLTDVNVYGKWSSPWCDDPRFKGPKQFSELEPILNDTRYTFIIPIERGWVTAKFWEMIHYGIVPFMHPTYDEEHNLKCPEFIRVKDPADLQRKIEILESNYQVYNSVLGELHEMLEDKYYDGSHIDNVVTEGINKLTRRSD
jgi:hypothetical protein